MRKKTIVLVIVIILLTVTGCWDRRPVDELGIIDNITINKTHGVGNQIKVNIIRPTFEKDKKEFDHKITVEADSLLAAFKQLQGSSNKIYVLGGIRNVLFGKEIAISGINKILAEIDHIRDFETQAFLAVFESTIEELENYKPPQQERTGLLIRDTIMSSVKSQYIPETRFHQIMSIYSLAGHEMVLPVINIDEEKQDIQVDKLGVFKGDKMVGSIDMLESIPYLLTTLRTVDELLLNIPDEETVLSGIEKLSVIVRNRKLNIRTQINNNRPVIDVDISLIVDLESYIEAQSDNKTYRVSKNNQEIVNEVENAVSSYLDKLGQNLIERTQSEFKSDIFGFGEKIRVQSNDYFTKVVWSEVYPRAEITCKFDVTLRKLGNVR